MPVLLYGSDTILWKEKESSTVRAVQMDTLKGLLGIRRMDRVSNARIRELCGARKGLDERIDEVVQRWLGHVERMERDRITKRVSVGECASSRSVGRPWKRCTNIVKVFKEKRIGCQASKENGAV